MQFYLHYKNKPYKVLGHARHSENLEELTLYETLYENKSGKLWVRPRQMFEENIVINGISTPRFRKVELQLTQRSFSYGMDLFRGHQDNSASADGILDSKDFFAQLDDLFRLSFPKWEKDTFLEKLTDKKNLSVFIAHIAGEMAGCKIGYELPTGDFYSWLGAVLPKYRRLGIASELVQHQHHWAKKNGFKSVRTKSKNSFPGMMILNLRHGFQVCGTEGKDEGLKILFEKKLND